MGFPYRLNRRHPIQLWVLFERKDPASSGNDRGQPVNVRYAGSNGLSATASPLLSLTLSRHRDDYWEPPWLLRLGGATFRFSSYTALLVSNHVLALLQVLMSREG